MKILILDDNKVEIDYLMSAINLYFSKRKMEPTIKVFEKTDEIINIINNFDLAFIDVELEGVNGIELAQNIRKFNQDIKIIFVSNYPKYLIDGYKAHADRYFLKPINQLEFEIEMDEIVNDYQYNNMGFYNKKIYCKKIYYKDILYIEFLQRKSYVHLKSGKSIETRLLLKEWLEMLEEYYFSRVHKSYIVNLLNINEYNNKNIILINNEIIPLSKSYYAKFESDFINHLYKRV